MNETIQTIGVRRSDGSNPPEPPTGAGRFPTLDARSLTGRDYRLPEGFEGARNLVLVGFELRHQGVIDAWLPALEPLVAARPGLRLYELVPISRSALPSRPIIDGGMVRGIPDEAVRARTLTAYADLRPVIAALGLPDTRRVAAVLVDRRGHVTWRARGAPDPSTLATLAAALGDGA